MAAMPHVFVCCESLISPLEETFSALHLSPAAAAAWIGEAEALQIRTVPVDHIPDSFGVRVDLGALSVVYSGDTRPCPQLFALANNCTLLLHEATFEDSLLSEAIEKKHSAISEVIKGAGECGCENLLLTHFSQRYPQV
ncbi:hypothetical protein, conserved [Eimeria acervulina]|uniref:ribonuclease Z n=1 Tax=Eimeria acervulina TaxID=5801 RepID=U6G8U3_EIMAC|nr:hypothetical protein, conserved [Eimeria acervulina]CDI76545.1 hypothetical protein, conserved [Eimeria acervulina]